MSENVLTRNQKRAIAALLSSPSLAAAAKACDLSVKTLQRYLYMPEFRQALIQAESEAVDGAGRLLLAGQPTALKTLNDLMTHATSESNKRLAATAWIDFALRFREIKNIEQRLADLEAAVYANQHK